MILVFAEDTIIKGKYGRELQLMVKMFGNLHLLSFMSVIPSQRLSVLHVLISCIN